MKKIKKLAGALLAMVMVLALAVPAFATGENPGTITLKNPSSTPVGKTHTYNVYRVFDMTLGGTDKDTNRPMAYSASAVLKEKIETADKVKGYFTFQAIAGDDNNFTVLATDAYKTESAAKEFSQWLNDNLSNLNLEKVNENPITLTGPDATETISVPYGYYFVDSTVGSLFMLDSTTPNATITDKNMDPVPEKTSKTDANVKIGDDIDYTVTVKVVDGPTDYTLVDTLHTGLALKAETIKVQLKDAEGALTDIDENDYALDTNPESNASFEISFSKGYLETIVGETIVVTYKATILNTAAVPEGATYIRLDNDVKVKYGDNKETETKTTNDPLYKFDLVKTDKDKKLLPGAEFELYSGDDVTVNDGGVATVNPEASAIVFIYNEDKTIYRVYNATDAAAAAGFGTETTTTITVTGGKITVDGLKGTFYLKETKAPDGYNALSELKKVEVNENTTSANLSEDGKLYVDGGVQVINYTGTELPETGGIGTTIFYIVGGVLVLAAVVVLITKRRTSADE